MAISACGSRPVVPVSEIETRNSAREIDQMGGRLVRLVQAGDTLHAIAFESGLSIKDLALWNGIGEASKIKAGQRLRLTKPRVLPRIPRDKPVVVERQTGVDQGSIERANTPSRPSQQASQVTTKISKKPKSHKQSWIWPTKGTVIRRFNPKAGQKGIDIKGKAGQPVYAALDGEVVYAGNGLKGYGNLIIIEHANEMLSAYAHNQEFYVREGQKVQKAVRIASMGMDNSRQAVVHFQIRQDGTPVNPASYLP